MLFLTYLVLEFILICFWKRNKFHYLWDLHELFSLPFYHSLMQYLFVDKYYSLRRFNYERENIEKRVSLSGGFKDIFNMNLNFYSRLKFPCNYYHKLFLFQFLSNYLIIKSKCNIHQRFVHLFLKFKFLRLLFGNPKITSFFFIWEAHFFPTKKIFSNKI